MATWLGGALHSNIPLLFLEKKKRKPSKEGSTERRKPLFCFQSWESLNNSFLSALGMSLIFILDEL